MEARGELYVDEGNGDPTDPEFGSSSDKDLRDVFESLLRIRRMANAGDPRTYTAALLALTKISCLARELGTWAAKDVGLICTRVDYARASPRQRRNMINHALYFQLPILQPQARVELAKSLAALDVGETSPLLEQAKTGRRRESPARIVQAEHGILRWIRWQYGRGRKLADVEGEVVRAINCTPTLFAKWKKELAKLYGVERIRNSLYWAEKLGRFEVALERGDIVPTELEQLAMRMEAAFMERDLAVLVADRLEGVKKRRAPAVPSGSLS